MKSLKDYTYEQVLNEGIIGDLLKGFWEWLTGKDTKKEYDALSSYYDEESKKKYINKFDSTKVKTKKITDKKILTKIIERSKDKDNEKSGFYRLTEYFKKHVEASDVSSTNKWISFIFDTDDLIESCGLVVYRTDDSKYSGKNVVYYSEFLPLYASVINYEYVYNELQKLENVIIKDKGLIKAFKNNDLEMEELDKDVYAI